MCTSHLGLVELRHLDVPVVPRLQPAVGDRGGVHAAALLLLKLCGARARLLCLDHVRLVARGAARSDRRITEVNDLGPLPRARGVIDVEGAARHAG